MVAKTQEATLAVLIAALATGVATGYLQVPPLVLNSSVSHAFLLVLALVFFAYSPVVGIAAFALFAIILFHRNIQKTVRYSRAAKSVYGIDNIASQEVKTQPYTTMHSEPREYNQFKDTYEPYSSPEMEGQYPLDEARQGAEPKLEDYFYRPGPDMGDNTFVATEPTLTDAKAMSFAY